MPGGTRTSRRTFRALSWSGSNGNALISNTVHWISGGWGGEGRSKSTRTAEREERKGEKVDVGRREVGGLKRKK